MNADMDGGEMMELEAAIANSSVGVTGTKKSGVSMSMNAGDAYMSRLKKLVDIIVVSVAGETDKVKIWEAVKSLRGKNYNLVMAELEASAEGLSDDEIKK